jgi:hypothetical protein
VVVTVVRTPAQSPPAPVVPRPTVTTTRAAATFDYADGVLVAAGQRWALGQSGDLVAIGDWDCDGQPTPALLRPSTGSVFVFAKWADAGADETPDLVDRVEAATSLTVTDVDRDGCDELVVGRAEGEDVVLRPPDAL